MDPIIIIAVLVVLLTAFSVVFGNMYYSRTYLPQKRRESLEKVLRHTAELNVAKDKNEKRLSVAEVLDRNSTQNHLTGIQKWMNKPLYEGPFADELTEDEWNHVHDFYPRAIEEAASERMRRSSHLRRLEGSEHKMLELSRAYKQAAEEVAQGRDPHSEEWAMLDSEAHGASGASNASSKNATGSTGDTGTEQPRRIESPRDYTVAYLQERALDDVQQQLQKWFGGGSAQSDEHKDRQ